MCVFDVKTHQRRQQPAYHVLWSLFHLLRIYDFSNKNIPVIGTARENRPLVDNDKLKKQGRGAVDVKFDSINEITVCKWFDNRPVIMTTNFAAVWNEWKSAQKI